jgi:translation initiation factor 1A
MVKNAGGNKSKRQGRKHVNAPQQKSIRYIKEEGEVYAVVTKLYGGSNCEVMCMDGNKRLCIIRNKFRGRDKRDNTIAPNVWVLVGVRDWEARIGKPQKCDLLEVYSDTDREKIKTNNCHDVSSLMNAFEDETSTSSKCYIDFVDNSNGNNTNDYTAEIEKEINEHGEEVVECSDDDVIDVDEI